MRRLNPLERWVYGTMAAAFVAGNVAVVLFGLTYWRWMGVFLGVCAAGMALLWYRTK